MPRYCPDCGFRGICSRCREIATVDSDQPAPVDVAPSSEEAPEDEQPPALGGGAAARDVPPPAPAPYLAPVELGPCECPVDRGVGKHSDPHCPGVGMTRDQEIHWRRLREHLPSRRPVRKRPQRRPGADSRAANGHRRVRAPKAKEGTVVGYVRVSSDTQVNGHGLEAQADAIERECKARNWELVEVVSDEGVSGKSLDRPGLEKVLDMLDRGEAAVLMAAKLDRLSRSVADFASLLDRSRQQGWKVVVLDVGADSTTPAGEMLVHVLSAFAQYERRLIGVRTKEALAAKMARGERVGRPRLLPPEVAERIARRRAEGATLHAIADELNADGVPTAQGGAKWHSSTIAKVLNYAEG